MQDIQKFKIAPKRLIIRRMLGPLLGVYLIGFLISGWLATQPYFQKAAEQYSALSAAPFSVSGKPYRAAQQLSELVFHYLKNIPSVCSSGDTVSDFQAKQCGVFWGRLAVLGGLALLPLILSIVVLLLVLDWVSTKYRVAARKIQKEKALFAGKTISQSPIPGDLFGWMAGLQIIEVSLPNQGKQKIYLPIDAPLPPSGQTMAIYKWGKIGKEDRYFGVIYAPHLAVIVGS